MTIYALDANCMIAASVQAHVHHDETVRAIELLDSRGATPVVVAHAIVESFSVMTRLPGATRVDPSTARMVLADSWGDAPVVSIPDGEMWTFLETAALQRVAGASVYDALIAHSSRGAKADLLLTWNVKDFVRWPMGGTRVLTPADLLASA